MVTGGNGFLGKYVVRKLQERGAEVLVADIDPSAALRVDLRRLEDVRRPLSEGRPQAVIHLAARVGGIPLRFAAGRLRTRGQSRASGRVFLRQPDDGCASAARGLAGQGGEIRRAGDDLLLSQVHAGALQGREPVPDGGYPEETNAPYGLAKKMLLVQSQAYRQQYGFNSIFLMPVNLYGPGDNPSTSSGRRFDPDSSHVIPALIRKCIKAKAEGKEKIVAWGDGSPTREFLYVEDAAEGILLAAERYNQSDPVNPSLVLRVGLGSSNETCPVPKGCCAERSRRVSIKDLVETIARLTGFEGEIRGDTSKPNTSTSLSTGGQPRRKPVLREVEGLDTNRAAYHFSKIISGELQASHKCRKNIPR
jgi:GDP-L-fucose synthase